MKKNPAYPWFDILMIIVVPKQYRNSRSCSTRQVLPKILQIHKKNKRMLEFLLKTLFRKKPHGRWLFLEFVKTFKNTLNTEHPQQQ